MLSQVELHNSHVLLFWWPEVMLNITLGVFATRLHEQGKSLSTFSTEALTALPPIISHPHGDKPNTPPRLVSDQLINIFFQEWAPLYPVVHRPTILKAYDRYLTDPESLSVPVITQLNLIFGIAALSSKVWLFFFSHDFLFINAKSHCSREPTKTPFSLSGVGTRRWSRFRGTFPSQLCSAMF